MVSGAELVGSWACRELNPYPDQPTVTTNLVLNADGSFVSEALLPMAETVPGASDMVMTTAGDWQVEGDRFVTQEAEVDVVAADGGEDAMASWMNTAAEFFMERAGDADAEIFRVTASEFVMRDDDPDAPTISCMRQA
jgi:hypothetical protein